MSHNVPSKDAILLEREHSPDFLKQTLYQCLRIKQHKAIGPILKKQLSTWSYYFKNYIVFLKYYYTQSNETKCCMNKLNETVQR